jgi:hypothetical protein
MGECKVTNNAFGKICVLHWNVPKNFFPFRKVVFCPRSYRARNPYLFELKGNSELLTDQNTVGIAVKQHNHTLCLKLCVSRHQNSWNCELLSSDKLLKDWTWTQSTQTLWWPIYRSFNNFVHESSVTKAPAMLSTSLPLIFMKSVMMALVRFWLTNSFHSWHALIHSINKVVQGDCS